MATNKNFVVKNGLEVGQNLVVTGSITQSGMSLPASDGSDGQFLKTDGNGTLSFASVVSDFTISDGTNTDTVNTGETLTFTAGTGITTTVSDNEVTISGATQYTDSDAIAAVQGATNLTIDGGTLYVDTANNYVGIGDTSPQYMLDVGGTTGTGSIAVAGTEVIDSGAEIITARLKDSGVTAGSYGSASLVPVITVDAKGRITSASTTSVAGVSSFSFNGTSEVLTINTADGGTFTADISALASETYVDTAVSNLVDAAPGTLDTLNELAAALGDDANFSTTVTNSLATKVSKNGDTISGALNVTGNLAIDTNTLFVDAANNRVGIGTASPSTPLHVSTSADRVATFASTDTGARIVITDGTDTGYVNVSSGKVSLGQTEGLSANNLNIDASGNVGIGTSSIGTNEKLLVKTSTDSSVNQGLVIQRSLNSDQGYINYQGGSFQFRSTDGDPLTFGQVSNIRMRINPDGNVGIGTASPGGLLDVQTAANRYLRVRSANADLELLSDNNTNPVFRIQGTGTADLVNIYDNTNEVFTILDGGNVGIGTASPSEKLHVQGDGADILLTDAGGGQTAKLGSSGSNNGVIELNNSSHTRTILLNSSGNSYITSGFAGIGTTSPTRLLHLEGNDGPSGTTSGNSDTQLFIDNNGNNGSILEFGASNDSQSWIMFSDEDTANQGRIQYAHSNDTMYFSTAQDRRMSLSASEVVFNDDSRDQDFRVESDSNPNMIFVDAGNNYVHFGTNQFMGSSSSGEGVTYANGEALRCQRDSGPSLIVNRVNTDGDALTLRKNGASVGSISVASTGTTYNTTSDRRLKDNIVTIADGKEKLLAMNPVTHTWKADPEADAVHGFIAQEMQQVVPEAVSGDPDGDEMMSMDYGRITPVIVAALQDALKEIEELKTRINELEAK